MCLIAAVIIGTTVVVVIQLFGSSLKGKNTRHIRC